MVELFFMFWCPVFSQVYRLKSQVFFIHFKPLGEHELCLVCECILVWVWVCVSASLYVCGGVLIMLLTHDLCYCVRVSFRFFTIPLPSFTHLIMCPCPNSCNSIHVQFFFGGVGGGVLSCCDLATNLLCNTTRHKKWPLICCIWVGTFSDRFVFAFVKYDSLVCIQFLAV